MPLATEGVRVGREFHLFAARRGGPEDLPLHAGRKDVGVALHFVAVGSCRGWDVAAVGGGRADEGPGSAKVTAGARHSASLRCLEHSTATDAGGQCPVETRPPDHSRRQGDGRTRIRGTRTSIACSGAQACAAGGTLTVPTYAAAIRDVFSGRAVAPRGAGLVDVVVVVDEGSRPAVAAVVIVPLLEQVAAGSAALARRFDVVTTPEAQRVEVDRG